MNRITAFALAALAAVGAVPLAACNKKTDELCLYDIAATFDPSSSSLTARMTFDFVNDTADEIAELKFNLWGNAFREGAKYAPCSAQDTEAYYDGVSYGGMTVTGVEGCTGWETGGEDQNILTVALPQSIYPDERAQVAITYTLNLAHVNARTGITEDGTVNLGNFYPTLCAKTAEGYVQTPYYAIGDPFVSECADYRVSITMPQNFTAATSGRELSRKVEGDLCTTSYELKRARDFAAVLSDNFRTERAEADGCAITLYYQGDTPPEGLAQCAAESITYFSETFGEYAYPTFSVVMTPLSSSGMEYPALVMIDPSLESHDAAYTVSHETAHQWWYAMVGSDQVNSAWQDEGLTEYSTLCFFEAHPAYGFTRASMLGNATKAYRAYFTVYSQIFGQTDTSMSRSLATFSSEYEYANIAYNKGLIMFDALRASMGDERFFAALKDYFQTNAFTIADEEHLISAMDERYDTQGLMEGFLKGKTVI